ncbi:MAG: Fic family protein [Candidatus Parcubacteria bacterium]|nr:Fic family protein [Candidatus Parcubacteria bacterium]
MAKQRLNKRIANLPDSVWKLVNEIDAIKGEWIGGANLNPQALGRLKRSTLVTSTGASTRIEGSKLSDEEVERLMRGLSVQKFKDRDEQEVRGYFELLSNVFEAWKHISFSESTIKSFHKELLKYADKDVLHRGEYKTIENKVHMVDGEGNSLGILFDTSAVHLTPKEMLELVEWAKGAFESKDFHPLLIMGNFIVEFLNIHPFQDGNGRISRILTNLLMLKNGYAYMPYISHEKLVEENKAEYYLALRKSQKTIKKENENIIPWLEFFLGVCLEQAKQATSLLSKENIASILSPKQIAVWNYLETVTEATPGEISKNTGVARPTVSQALDVLLRLKKVKRLGQGRTTRYTKI